MHSCVYIVCTHIYTIMCVYVYAYIYIYIQIHMHICTCIHQYTNFVAEMCEGAGIYIHTEKRTSSYFVLLHFVLLQSLYIDIYIYWHGYIYIHVNTYTHIWTYRHAYIRIYVQKYTSTCPSSLTSFVLITYCIYIYNICT